MVADRHNKVYTELLTYLKTIYPDIKGGTTFNESNAKLPYMYFFLIDEPTVLTTLSQTEDGVDTSYQIEIYSDKGTDYTRRVSSAVREFMISHGFICQRFRPIQRASSISRFVAIYSRLDV